jgi:hypothetical protein
VKASPLRALEAIIAFPTSNPRVELSSREMLLISDAY